MYVPIHRIYLQGYLNLAHAFLKSWIFLELGGMDMWNIRLVEKKVSTVVPRMDEKMF